MSMALDEKVKMYLVVKDGALTDLAGNISTWDVNTVQIANSGGPYNNNACLHFDNTETVTGYSNRFLPNNLLYTDLSNSIDLNSEEWTLSFWFKYANTITEYKSVDVLGLSSIYDDYDVSLRVWFDSGIQDVDPETGEDVYDFSHVVVFFGYYFGNNGYATYTYLSPEYINDWHHYCIVKNNNNLYTYIDGNRITIDVSTGNAARTDIPQQFTEDINCLTIQRGTTRGYFIKRDNIHYNDYMDEICFVEDALWTSDFTPPTEYLYELPPIVYKRWPSPVWEYFKQEFIVFFSMAVANTVLIDGVEIDSLDHVSHFGVCSTAAGIAAKTVSIPQFNLVAGARVTVKFDNTNTESNPTLNVNNTGAVSIMYKGSNISAGALSAGSVREFIYDGTNYCVVGDLIV